MKTTNGLTPVGPGNTLSVKHGMGSPAIVGAKADELRPVVTSVAPWTAAPEFRFAVDMYVRALATALLGLQYIAETVAKKGLRRRPEPDRRVASNSHDEYRTQCRVIVRARPIVPRQRL